MPRRARRQCSGRGGSPDNPRAHRNRRTTGADSQPCSRNVSRIRSNVSSSIPAARSTPKIPAPDPGSRGSRDRPDLHPCISPCCIMQPKLAASVRAACGKTFADIRSWLVRCPRRLRHAVHGHEDRFRSTTSLNREPPPDIAPCVAARSNPRGRGAALPARTVAAHAAALPPSADVLGLRDRGAVRARRAAGRLAGGSAHRALPPVRHQRIRPGPGARECAAAAGLMSATCCIRALQLGAAPAAGGRVRWLRLPRIGDAAAGKQR